jgi:hypothetical protein
MMKNRLTSFLGMAILPTGSDIRRISDPSGTGWPGGLCVIGESSSMVLCSILIQAIFCQNYDGPNYTRHYELEYVYYGLGSPYFKSMMKNRSTVSHISNLCQKIGEHHFLGWQFYPWVRISDPLGTGTKFDLRVLLVPNPIFLRVGYGFDFLPAGT